MREFTIQPNDAGQRLDKFLSKAVPLLPASLMHKYIRIKRIKLNGKRCESAQKLAVGDRLSLYINDEFFESIASNQIFLRADSDLNIIYEDENILLADKPAGLLVHEDDKQQVDTLINRIQKYLFEKGEYQPDQELSFVPALCNRIDMNTSGIVIAAKNAATLRIINQKIKDRELAKRYLCMVHGHPPKSNDLLKGYLIKNADENLVQIFSTPRPGAKTILTKYRVLAKNPRYSLLEVDLLTGRTHQIRAHMAFAGFPLVGDTKYGLNRQNKDTGYRFQALCSYQLQFEFTTDAGILEYLNHRIFTVHEVPFLKEFNLTLDSLHQKRKKQ